MQLQSGKQADSFENPVSPYAKSTHIDTSDWKGLKSKLKLCLTLLKNNVTSHFTVGINNYF